MVTDADRIAHFVPETRHRASESPIKGERVSILGATYVNLGAPVPGLSFQRPVLFQLPGLTANWYPHKIHVFEITLLHTDAAVNILSLYFSKQEPADPAAVTIYERRGLPGVLSPVVYSYAVPLVFPFRGNPQTVAGESYLPLLNVLWSAAGTPGSAAEAILDWYAD
jgi:hypothetical protein